MSKLIFASIASLDGYVADSNGRFGWGEPDHEVHAFVNDLSRPLGTYLYGRRLYEVMVAWETMPLEGEPDAFRDYAEIWRAAHKIVYSRTLTEPTSANTRIESEFEIEAVRRMKAEAERDMCVGGPALAAHAFRAGLVDECHLFLAPVIVGGGTRAFPDDVRLDLELIDERRFDSGFVYVRYLLGERHS